MTNVFKKSLFFLMILQGLLMFVTVVNAQDGSQTDPIYNRYGQSLQKSGDGWIVPNEARLASKFDFDPNIVEGWRKPWKYVPNKIQPKDMKKYNFETFEYKVYPDYACKMDVYLPKGQGSGSFPFVLVIHGGGWTTGHEKTPNMVVLSEWFSSNGIACMNVSYTLSGQGTFENTKSDLNDALKFIGKYAKKWNVDTTRFGFYGFSAGGHLSAYMAMTTPGTKMFIAAAGPGDMTHNLENYSKEGDTSNSRMARYWDITPDNLDGLRKASPIFHIPQPGFQIPSALIIQGLMDGIVNPQQSIRFASELMNKGASNVEFMGLAYAGHATVNQRYYLFEDHMFQLLYFAKRNLNK